MQSVRFVLLVPFLMAVNMLSAQQAFDYKRDFKPFLQQSQDRESPLAYSKLLIRFLDRDTSLSNMEMLALMIGFTEDPHFKPFEDMDSEKEVFDLNEEGKFDDAIDKSRRYLQSHPLSLRVLKEASYAYHRKEMKDSADYYMDLVEKIMNAMIYSGTGKKPESPIFSLGLADGEYFIPNIGMKILDKDTDWNSNNQFIEIVKASKSGVDEINFYFIIDHAKNKVDDDKIDSSTEAKAKKAEKKKKDKEKKEKEKEKKEKEKTKKG